MGEQHLTLPARIERAILFIRGHRILLDADLAKLYGTSTRALVQAVKRNAERFPPDFKFQLTPSEFADLRSRSVTSSGWGGRRTPPYAFTEQGVCMLSSVLHSRRAINVNIEIMRAFMRLRKLLNIRADTSHQVAQLEVRYDTQFKVVFEAIRQLAAPSAPKKQRRIGFRKAKGKDAGG